MKIIVVMGGSTSEREVSLRSGAGVARALAELGHEPILLDTGTGKLLRDADQAMALGTRPPSATRSSGSTLPAVRAQEGLESYVRSIPRAADLVFVALHGGDGENGTLQALLDLAGIPYTGSGVLASALAMDKAMSKRIFRVEGIPTPEWVELWAPEDPSAKWNPEISKEDLGRLGGFPVIVKPNEEGSSVGITVVKSATELLPAIEEARRYGRLVLIESFIEGRELTVGLIENRTFPVVEIIPEAGWYDYAHKYTAGASRYEVPASIPPEMSERLFALSLRACRALRCRGVARVDFRLGEDGVPQCLEVNTVPGLTELSLVPKAAAAAGMSYTDLIRAVVDAAPVRVGR
ncbi:MAG TPA: D-alanine--D-alanine ligase [Candidatus Eisenbacteria bacterium]|nr:D-alanine--D-alanine ligase [Candidatus Eisenbacteria bacterium]